MARGEPRDQELYAVHPSDEYSNHKRKVADIKNKKFAMGDYCLSVKDDMRDDQESFGSQIFPESVNSDEEDGNSQLSGFTHEHVTGPNITCFTPPRNGAKSGDEIEIGCAAANGMPGGTTCVSSAANFCGEMQTKVRKENDALDFVFEMVETAMCGEGTTTLNLPAKSRRAKRAASKRQQELSEKSIYLLRNNSIMEKSLRSERSHIESLRRLWSEEDEKPEKRSNGKKCWREQIYRELVHSISSSSLTKTNKTEEECETTVSTANESEESEKRCGDVALSTEETETSQTPREPIVLSAAVAARVEKEIEEARKRMMAEYTQKDSEVTNSIPTKEDESVGIPSKVDVGTSITTIFHTTKDFSAKDPTTCSQSDSTDESIVAETGGKVRELVVFSKSSISSMGNENVFFSDRAIAIDNTAVSTDERRLQLMAEIVEFFSSLYKELSGQTKGQRVPVAKGLYFLACLVFFLFWPTSLKKEKQTREGQTTIEKQLPRKASLLDLVQES